MDKQKLQSLYNLASLDAAVETAKTFTDAGGLLLARSLEHVSPEIFTQEYPELTLLSQSGIIVNNEGGFANSIRKIKARVNGEFAEVGADTNGTGKISLSAEDDSISVIYKEASSGWSELELKQAELENINLTSRLLDAHNELYQRDIDRIGYLGKRGTGGLLNFGGFTATAAAGAAATLTGQELYDEIAGLINQQHGDVKNVETYKADRVVLPTLAYNEARREILNSNGSAMSVLSALQANFPDVQFLTTAKADDVGGSTVTVAFSSARRAMQMRIPTPLMVSNVWQQGFKSNMESMFGVAGLDVIENKAGQILTGL